MLALLLAVPLQVFSPPAVLPLLDYSVPQPYFAVGYFVSDHKTTAPDGKSVANAGSATLIGPRNADGTWPVVTAHHVSDGKSGKIYLKDGRVLDLEAVKCDVANDVCWMRTKSSVLVGLPYALVAEGTPRSGDKLTICGYGIGKQARCRSGEVVELGWVNRLTWKAESISGDSGGGVFLDKPGHPDHGRLVGCVWGGDAHSKDKGVGTVFCGPTRAVRNANPFRRLPAVKKILPQVSPFGRTVMELNDRDLEQISGGGAKAARKKNNSPVVFVLPASAQSQAASPPQVSRSRVAGNKSEACPGGVCPIK